MPSASIPRSFLPPRPQPTLPDLVNYIFKFSLLSCLPPWPSDTHPRAPAPAQAEGPARPRSPARGRTLISLSRSRVRCTISSVDIFSTSSPTPSCRAQRRRHAGPARPRLAPAPLSSAPDPLSPAPGFGAPRPGPAAPGPAAPHDGLRPPLLTSDSSHTDAIFTRTSCAGRARLGGFRAADSALPRSGHSAGGTGGSGTAG